MALGSGTVNVWSHLVVDLGGQPSTSSAIVPPCECSFWVRMAKLDTKLLP